MKKENFRIRKLDKENWVVERFEEGGELAKRGRTVGKPKASRWVVEGYYTQLKFAAQRLCDTMLGEGADIITGREIISRIEAVEVRAMKIVEAAVAALPKTE